MAVQKIKNFLLTPSNLFIFWLTSFFLVPYQIKFIGISPSSIITLLILMLLSLNYKINNSKKEIIIPSLLCLLLVFSIIFTESQFHHIFDLTSTYRAYLVSIFTFFILIHYLRQYGHKVHSKIFRFYSLFLLFSGILGCMQYFGLDFSPAVFLLDIPHDNVGSGFASYPQSNAGLICLAFTFYTSTLIFFNNYSHTFYKNIYNLVCLFFGAAAIINCHNKSLLITLGLYLIILLIYIFVFFKDKIFKFKKFLTMIMILALSIVMLLSIYSFTGNKNSKIIFDNFRYFSTEMFTSNLESHLQVNQNSSKNYEQISSITNQVRSANSRADSLKFAINHIRNNLFLGHGAESFYSEYKKFRENRATIDRNSKYLDDHPSIPIHNHFISFIYAYGLIGTLILFFLIAYPFFLKKKNIFFAIHTLNLGAMIFWGMFQANLHERIFWITLAMFYISLSNKNYLSIVTKKNDNS